MKGKEVKTERKTEFQEVLAETLEKKFGNYRREYLKLSDLSERDKYQAQIIYNKNN